MQRSEFDPLTYAIGARTMATTYAGNLRSSHPAYEDAERREREANARLIATRAAHPGHIMCKLEIVLEHVSDERGRYGPLFDDLQRCIGEAARPVVDFVCLEAALTALAQRLDREEAGDFFVSLTRSAAADARALAT